MDDFFEFLMKDYVLHIDSKQVKYIKHFENEVEVKFNDGTTETFKPNEYN
jgi:hypothetical protein